MAQNKAANGEGGADACRRRFLGGTALAAMGTVIGGVMPISENGAGIPGAVFATKSDLPKH